MRLSDKVALVTGGSGALGTVIALRLSSEGARVTATYHHTRSLTQVSESFKTTVALTQADMTNEQDVKRLYDDILSKSSRIDIAVNTIGGFLPRKPLTEVTLEEWDLMMNVNLKTTFLSTREALRRMKGQSYGRIVNISAMAGLNPAPGRTPYAISKAAVSLFSELAAQEVKASGITINAIAPGIIATRANIESLPGEDVSKWVTTEQIADIVCHLCSSSAGSITGTTVKAYGGV